MKLVLPFTLYAYSTSPAIFGLKLPYKLTLESTLHSRVKDFTTDNSTVLFYANSKARLLAMLLYTTILFKTIVLLIGHELC